MAKKPKPKPNTIASTGSSLEGLMGNLNPTEPDEDMPKLPEPLFDKYMGSMFKKKKPKV